MERILCTHSSAMELWIYHLRISYSYTGIYLAIIGRPRSKCIFRDVGVRGLGRMIYHEKSHGSVPSIEWRS